MIKALVQEWWQELQEDVYSFYGTIALSLLAVGWGSYQGYHYYRSYQERKAQLVVAEAFEEFDKALYYKLEGKDSQEVLQQRFEDARLAFDEVIQSAGSSYLYPYALAFQADITLQQGDTQGALDLLKQSVQKLNASMPAYYLIKTKLALVLMDHGSLEQGLKELELLAHDKANPTYDTAAFYAGYYYWTQKDFSQVEHFWKLLKPTQTTPENGISPWWSLAEEKLQQINVQV